MRSEADDDRAGKTMRTPLARVRSLGASHSGTSDFWRQRLTAVAMTLLIVPVIVVVLMLIGSNQAGAAQISARCRSRSSCCSSSSPVPGT